MESTTSTAVADHLQTAGEPSGDQIQAAERIAVAQQELRQQMSRVIIGQDDVLDLLMLALLCQGHCILEGVPGLAKTLMIS
ncbi:MAG: hypothetical protein QF735_11825, partial [Phycisphaeraceae bacterium]|nr:hypothetical protein [Phycisphaeraceae bacterium]